MQRLLSLAAEEWLGTHRLQEVVNEEQEQAPKEDQAHHSQQHETADEESVHNLQEHKHKDPSSSQPQSAPGAWREHTTSWNTESLRLPQISLLAFHPWHGHSLWDARTRTKIPAKSSWECSCGAAQY